VLCIVTGSTPHLEEKFPPIKKNLGKSAGSAASAWSTKNIGAGGCRLKPASAEFSLHPGGFPYKNPSRSLRLAEHARRFDVNAAVIRRKGNNEAISGRQMP